MKKSEWTQTHETRYHALVTKKSLGQPLLSVESALLKDLHAYRRKCLPMSPEEIKLVDRSNVKTLKLISALRRLIVGDG